MLCCYDVNKLPNPIGKERHVKKEIYKRDVNSQRRQQITLLLENCCTVANGLPEVDNTSQFRKSLEGEVKEGGSDGQDQSRLARSTSEQTGVKIEQVDEKQAPR